MADEAEQGPIVLPFRIGLSPTLKIRGLIATKRIKPREIIERCPIILIPMREEQALMQTVLGKYYYEWNNENHILALGYASLINHSYQPSARYAFSYKKKEMVIIALGEIKPGEEITVNYNYEPDSLDPLEPKLVDFNKHKPS
jgi:uncharacterized protein